MQHKKVGGATFGAKSRSEPSVLCSRTGTGSPPTDVSIG